MHDILEGVLQYELKLLPYSIREHHFTFDILNSNLECFDFGYMEDRPATTTLFDNTNCLKQKGKVHNTILYISCSIDLIVYPLTPQNSIFLHLIALILLNVGLVCLET